MIEKQKIFDSWIDAIESKIDSLKNNLKNEISKQLDYSQQSVNVIEAYILENYNIQSIQEKDKFEELDKIVSYIGESLKRIFIDSVWKIYLEDETNIYHGLPCVLTKYSGPICLHFLLREILTNKTGDVLAARIQKATNYEQHILSAMRKKNNDQSN